MSTTTPRNPLNPAPHTEYLKAEDAPTTDGNDVAWTDASSFDWRLHAARQTLEEFLQPSLHRRYLNHAGRVMKMSRIAQDGTVVSNHPIHVVYFKHIDIAGWFVFYQEVEPEETERGAHGYGIIKDDQLDTIYEYSVEEFSLINGNRLLPSLGASVEDLRLRVDNARVMAMSQRA